MNTNHTTLPPNDTFPGHAISHDHSPQLVNVEHYIRGERDNLDDEVLLHIHAKLDIDTGELSEAQLREFDEAIATAKVFAAMHAARQRGEERDAVKDDAKLLGQCVLRDITHFATDDAACAQRIAEARSRGIVAGLPRPISLHAPIPQSWISGSHDRQPI